MRAMGGLMAAKYVWEGAIVPSLLSGAGTWVGCTARENHLTSTKGNAESDVEGRDGKHEDEDKNMETESDAGEKD